MMPSNVKIFWWISVATVAYWAVSTTWYLAFPTAHYLAVLAKLPPHLREGARNADIEYNVAGVLFWSSVTLVLASLAAFRRRNWARWAYSIAFLFRELLPCIALGYVYLVPSYSTVYRQLFLKDVWKSIVFEWSDARNYIVPVATAIAIVVVFTGNARGWFKGPKMILDRSN